MRYNISQVRYTAKHIGQRIKWGALLGNVVDSSIEEPSLIHPTAHVTKSKIAIHSEIHENVTLQECSLGIYCKIFANGFLYKSQIGDYSYTNTLTSVLRTRVGKFCSIASQVYVGATAHPLNKVTTHAFTFLRDFGDFIPNDDPEALDLRENTHTVVGNDVWIGHNAIILPNITIGDGAVVGAGSVVTKDVGAYQIVAGVPARLIRCRFQEDDVQKLLAIAWWDWDRQTILSRIDDFRDVQGFIERYFPV